MGGASGSFGNNDLFPGDGTGTWSGSAIGVVGGYNFQRGNLIYGGELAYSFSSAAGVESCRNSAFNCGGDMSSLASLSGRVGYLIQPNTMIFGSAGIVSANLEFATEVVLSVVRFPDQQTVGGYVVGLGVEHAITPKISGRFAINHYMFNDADFQTDILYPDLGGSMTAIEIGIIFHF